MNYAIIQNGTVINTIEWDGVSPWQPPTGTTVVPIQKGTYVGIGSAYDGATFGPPTQPAPTV